jgi:hypothetical protein
VRNKVEEVALQNGNLFTRYIWNKYRCSDFDTAKITTISFPTAKLDGKQTGAYRYGLCFGEQAYETIDELLKPFKKKEIFLNVESVSIMGKAGILEGGKGDIMIPKQY